MRQIAGVNKRRQAGGWYLDEANLSALLAETYESALDWATLEVHEGMHSTDELDRRHDRNELLANALTMIRAAQQQKEGRGD